MEPLNYFMSVVTQHYADFKGRARRAEYWWFVLAIMIVFVVLGILSNIVSVIGYLTGLFALGIVIPLLAVGVRRMHDTDHSGWWLLVPIANIIFYFTPGTSGPNRFGPDPKA